MNTIKVILLFLCPMIFSDQGISQTSHTKPEFQFEETRHDFGTINQGDKVSHTFKFKNTGSGPLVISNVITTCGCTAPSWPKEPVLPGNTDEIKITFDSTGKIGKQNKVITILANTEKQRNQLFISASVNPSE